MTMCSEYLIQPGNGQNLEKNILWFCNPNGLTDFQSLLSLSFQGAPKVSIPLSSISEDNNNKKYEK